MNEGVRRTASRASWRVARAVALGGVVTLGSAACLPRDRINATCRWTESHTVLAPPRDPARRTHLLADVRLAYALGVRYADSAVGRPPRSMASWDSARGGCVAGSLAVAARRHGVPQSELRALAGAREPWIDLVAVFLPMATVFGAVVRLAVGRLVRGAAPADRRRIVTRLAMCAPFAAALALSVTQLWSVVVETIRLGDEHVGDRAFQLPASRHAWRVWGLALGLFAMVAARIVMRRDATHSATRDRPPSRSRAAAG